MTLDTDTNLEWLDWTASTSLSYDSIVGMFGSGGLYEGWRHADVDEVSGLYAAAGLPLSGWPSLSYIDDDAVSFNNMADFVGKTSTTTSGAVHSTSSNAGEHHAASFEKITWMNPDRTVTSETWITVDDTLADPYRGHALVRAVPAPATGSLLILGAFGLVLARNRRARDEDRGFKLGFRSMAG
ncbi:MAG: PEP-CTERM sorting domain-containing protein [bacterium]|nr:PEP-CTERM sorting domain-containing protein [bacterium]